MIEVFLDRFLIEEIPVENATDTGIVNAAGEQIVRSQKSARKPMYGKILSCDTQFPRGGLTVSNPFKVGDVVKCGEYGRDYITFSIEDELPSAVKRFLMRYDDIEGRIKARGCMFNSGGIGCKLPEGHKGDHVISRNPGTLSDIVREVISRLSDIVREVISRA